MNDLMWVPMQINFLNILRTRNGVLLSLGISDTSLTEADTLADSVDPGFDKDVLVDLPGTHEFHVKLSRYLSSTLLIKCKNARSCRDIHVGRKCAAMCHVKGVPSEAWYLAREEH